MSTWAQSLWCALVVALSLFMVIWVWIGPASWRLGWNRLPGSAMHRAMLEEYFRQQTADGSLGLVPRSLVFKYEGHTAVQTCHGLASGIWSCLVPFQFHAAFCRRFPSWHRWMGRLFLSLSALMMVGLALLFQQGFVCTQYNYGDVASPELKFKDTMGTVGMALWFVHTGGRAWWAIRHGRIAQHQAWMIRHVSTSLWVALQQIFLNVVFGPAQTRLQQCENFSNSGVLGIGVGLAVGELAVVGLIPGGGTHIKTTSHGGNASKTKCRINATFISNGASVRSNSDANM